MKTLIITIGLPRSGKSTWARKQGIPIVNPDSIRLAIHGKNFIQESEDLVWCIAKYMVKALFLAGHDNIILDATNLTSKRRQFWISDNWRCVQRYFHVSVSTCIQRARDSGREDLIPIIKEMDQSKEVDP